MKKKFKIELHEYEFIITAWAERSCGPGWENQLIWYLVENRRDGSRRMDYLQPAEQGPEIQQFFSVFAETDALLMRLVNAQVCIPTEIQT